MKILFRAALGIAGTAFLLYLSYTLMVSTFAPRPDAIKPFGDFTDKVTSCMIEKSWGSLSENSQKILKESGDLKSLASDELSKVVSRATECAGK